MDIVLKLDCNKRGENFSRQLLNWTRGEFDLDLIDESHGMHIFTKKGEVQLNPSLQYEGEMDVKISAKRKEWAMHLEDRLLDVYERLKLFR